MSHSVFKEFPGSSSDDTGVRAGAPFIDLDFASGGESEGDNVVIVLNKDGSVSVDQNALHSFLRNDERKTAISVVRVQSPTPSLEAELREQGPSSSDEETNNSSNDNDCSDKDTGASPGEDSSEGDSEDRSLVTEDSQSEDNDRRTKAGKSKRQKRNKRAREPTPHVRLTVEQYLGPEEAKLFAAEILQYAGMTSTLSLDVDYDFQRFVVQNDHCYTPLTSPSQKDGCVPTAGIQKANSKGGQPKRKEVAEKQPITQRRAKAQAIPRIDEVESEHGEDSDGALDGEEEQQDDDEDYSVSESENDRDSDLDFRVNNNYMPKKKRTIRKSRPSLNSSTSSRQRRDSVGHLNISAPKASGNQPQLAAGPPQRKVRQSVSGPSRDSSGRITKNWSAESSEDRRIQTKLPFKATSQQPAKPISNASEGANLKAKNIAAERPIPPTVIKKEKKHDSLFKDIGSLFSTPDIIKKVGLSQGGEAHPANKSFTGMSPIRKIESAGGGAGAQQSLDTIQLPSAFEMELINSLVGVDEMEGSVVKVEDGVKVEPHSMDLTDASILDSIAGEDGLPEELLQHVAELVENKSLQEVIDKQVLGVADPMAHLTGLLPKQAEPQQLNVPQPLPQAPVTQVKKESPFVKLAQQKQLAKQSAAAAASLTAPRKEPIKIVRSDGRVITLPPIEAPTTRAKRRAQNSEPGPPPKQQAIVQLDDPPATQMVEILSAQSLSSPAPVVKRKSGSDRGSTSRRASMTPSVAESDVMDDMWNSEDDPDRLWCICKQPHNNRFMICCDTCEDWFHGKCVNITKQMGQQMEAEGREWTCPNCKQGLKGNQQVCVVCERLAKPSSIFCSDECIVKHSEQAQIAIPVPQTEVKKIGIIKTKQGRVIVYNKITREYLSDTSAPLLSELKEWLKDNPGFALVEPGTDVAHAFKLKQAQLQQLSRDMALNKPVAKPIEGPEKIQSKLKLTTNKQVVIVHPKTAQQIKVVPVENKSLPDFDKSPRLKVRKSTHEPTTSMGQRNVQRGEVEPIRLNVRKTFKEQLALRMMEVAEGNVKLNSEEIEQFALETEQEMFALFSRDTGHKYKAKYRSLMFNIKDRKNQTLFQKICEKAVKPFRLVRMTPEELASQELAKWRENENKHQLDMIKKSEMDLLACAKNYVLKSHKGEEVIENMIKDKEIETVDVTMLSELDKDPVAAAATSMGDPSKAAGSNDTRLTDSEKKDRKRDRSRDRHRHRHHSSSSKHHKRKRSRDKDRSREKERERGGSSASSKHKSSTLSSTAHNLSHHSSSSTTRDSKSAGGLKKEGSRHKDKVQAIIKEESNNSSSPASTTSSSNNKSAGESSSGQLYKPSQKETKESFDLIGKILQGTSPELVAKLQELEKRKTMDVVETEAATKSTIEEEYNPESTDLIRPPESPPVPAKAVWKGSISHADIAEVHAFATLLYGEIDNIQMDLPKLFNICGRIEPAPVWDYLAKIKKSPNREISLLKFEVRSPDNVGNYEHLYSYLQSKGRFAVIKVPSPIIKDFYLVPLKKGKLLPSVLLTLKGMGSFESRTNCLLGIVVKSNLKRPPPAPPSSSSGGPVPSKMMKVVPATTEDRIPPSSRPKVSANKLTVGLPTVSHLPTLKNDEDEPYSPGGSDNEEESLLPLVAPPPPVVDSQDLQKEVERLNRQIEASKNEIVEMLSKDTLEEEAYSPSRPVSPSDAGNKEKMPLIPLANISIPSNLQEILATLQNAGSSNRNVTAPVEEDEDDFEEYNPVSISNKMSSDTYKPSSAPASPSTKAFLLAQQQQQQGEEIPFITGSKLSHMTDAELMNLVPDGVTLPPVDELPMPPGLGGGEDEEYDPNE